MVYSTKMLSTLRKNAFQWVIYTGYINKTKVLQLFELAVCFKYQCSYETERNDFFIDSLSVSTLLVPLR